MTEVPCAELYYFIWCCALHLRRHWPAEAAPALSRCARTCRSDVILIIFIRAHGRDALTRRILDTRIFFFFTVFCLRPLVDTTLLERGCGGRWTLMREAHNLHGAGDVQSSNRLLGVLLY